MLPNGAPTVASRVTGRRFATKAEIDYPTRPLKPLRGLWRGGRAAEGARLESVYTATYQGFESLSLRQLSIQRDAKNIKNPQAVWLSGFFIVQ